jgi:hypothetical protein
MKPYNRIQFSAWKAQTDKQEKIAIASEYLDDSGLTVPYEVKMHIFFSNWVQIY